MARPKRIKRIQGIEQSLDRLVKRLDLKPLVLELQVCHAWSEVVGTSIAQRSVAERLAGNTLYVIVESPTWMNELRYIEERILHQLAEKVGPRAVKKLRFRVGALPPHPRIRASPAPAPGPGPLDPELREAVTERVAHIEDPELRAAALRALLAQAKKEL